MKIAIKIGLFAIFWNLLNFYRNFRENLGKTYKKILGICICKGSGGGGRSTQNSAKLLQT